MWLVALALLVMWTDPDTSEAQAAREGDSATPLMTRTVKALAVSQAQGRSTAPWLHLQTWRQAEPPRKTTASRHQKRRVNCKVERCVALTFDDGPGLTTDHLVNVLNRHHAHATFFVVGEMVAARPAVARKIARSGHELGVHSWNHANLTYVSPRQLRQQLMVTKRLIARTTGAVPLISRPPYGASNRWVRSAERRAGLSEILWTVDPSDWRDRAPLLIRARVLQEVRRNSVVLLHDLWPTSVMAAEPIIVGLIKQGYRLVTVSELLGTTTPGRRYFDLRGSR